MKDKFEYEGARGIKFFIFPGSGLFKSSPRWLVCAEQVETSKIYARTVAQVEPQWIEQCAAHLVKRCYYAPHWDRQARKVMVFERVTLFGLTLVEQRQVPYGKINPSEAREIFIRSALVGQDIALELEFFRHNLALLEELCRLQHKARRLDPVVDEELLFEFYHLRIPAEIVDADGLARWYLQAVRHQPELLKLSREILQHVSIDAADFPDVWEGEGVELQLCYRFEPGSETDGVCLKVPLLLLPQLDQAAFDWLVPGLLEEKLIFLFKGLPRSLRRQLVPIPELARRVRAELRFGEGPFCPAVAQALKRVAGLEVSPELLKAIELPAYLRMNFQVIDERGQELAKGRDLEKLKAKLTVSARKGFDSLSWQGEWTRTGVRSWQFGELPRTYQISQAGRKITGFPALVDEGESCGVKLFATAEEACQAHCLGLNRLIQLVLAREIKYLKQRFPFSAADELAYARLPPHPFLDRGDLPRPLVDEVVDLLVAEVFLATGSDIRSREAFEACLAANRGRLFPMAQEIAAKVKQILELARACRERRSRMRHLDHTPSGADIDEQLDLVCYRRFLRRIPWLYLRELPRYLNALQYRLDKAEYETPKDESKLKHLKPFWDSYWSKVRAGDVAAPDADPLRWSLEEFRIQLFAQHIKTAYPISEKRLAEALKQYRAA